MKTQHCVVIIASVILVALTAFTARSQAQDQNLFLYVPLVIKNYPPIKSGMIVFGSYLDGSNAEIYKVSAAGGTATRLTFDPAQDAEPDWSPDSSKILFASNRSGQYDIYSMNSDGSNLIRLTTTGSCHVPKWSPDGTQIAFNCRQNSHDYIFTMSASGANLSKITDDTVSATFPYWSPDGTQIAFISGDAVYVMDANGANRFLLFEAPGISHFAWSPDGEIFAVSKFSSTSNGAQIYTYVLDTATWNQLSNAPANHLGIDWSPDGQFLVFHSNRENISNFDIFTMRADGQQMENITNTPGFDLWGDWIQ